MFKKNLGFMCLFLLIMTICVERTSSQEEPADQVAKDLKTAYTIAQTYFTDNPSKRLKITDLYTYGFRSADSVRISVSDGRKNHLVLTGANLEGTRRYQIDKNGQITGSGLSRSRLPASESAK